MQQKYLEESVMIINSYKQNKETSHICIKYEIPIWYICYLTYKELLPRHSDQQLQMVWWDTYI